MEMKLKRKDKKEQFNCIRRRPVQRQKERGVEQGKYKTKEQKKKAE